MTAEIFIQRFPPFCFVVIGGIFDEKACVGKVGWHCHANIIILSVGISNSDLLLALTLLSSPYFNAKKKLLEEASLEFFTIPRVKD